ncbi:type VII secretion protein EccCa [Microbacterium sp. NPDC008134]|uniref:type VII secretion protein EccCa n=1 Tax=Microbacterium sp. NPDC008134 TaxID=3364183 RepID=UPI0036E397A2
MTQRIVHRPARAVLPAEPPEGIVLTAPPASNDAAAGFPLQSVLPIVGSLSSITMMVLLRGNPMFVVIGAVILVVALVGGIGMAFTTRGNAARQRRLQRERYLDHLERVRVQQHGRAEDVRGAALLRHPSPSALVEIGHDPARRWECRPSDPDFLHARIGTGDLPVLPVALPEESNPVQPYDPIMKAAAERLVRSAGVVQGMPATIDLSTGGQYAIVGERVHALRAARALAVQLATFHSPDEVHLAAVVPASAVADWCGFDLLPHVNAPRPAGDQPLARRSGPDLDALIAVIAPELRDRVATTTAARRAGRRIRPVRLVLFIDEGDGYATTPPRWDSVLDAADLGITIVHLVDDRLKEPENVVARITVDADRGGIETLADPGATVVYAPDAVEQRMLETIARPLAALRISRATAAEATDAVAPDLGEMLGLGDVARIDPDRAWGPRSSADFLRVPIGVDDTGAPVLLDLKESAQLGMGPHGICIGATGSGKSELLRTLVLGLAATHGPEDLSMILVDYKGGAAFAPFARLPHVAGIIDNLADDPQLTERARASINGEVVRRQQLLKAADNSASITHYRQLRRTRPELPALPHLFLVIDEFGELLTAEPEFVDLLLTIGRIGRSIGVHLLLSSQRIESGRLRGLETYLSYRIGLRTFSAAESAMVLDTQDAFHLPAIPGYAYLKVDTSVYTRLRAGYVSGPVDDVREHPVETAEEPQVRMIGAYDRMPSVADAADVADAAADAEPEPSPLREHAPTEAALPERALVDVAVERLAKGAPRTRPVWLAPLPLRVALGSLLPSSAAADDVTGLSIPIGLLDEPAHQRQLPWSLDLTRSGGHVSVMGAPQSGRSTFLRTVAASIAVTRTPQQVSVYGLDLTGGGLARIEGFPHVGGVATRGHRERVGRLLEELTTMLGVREQLFRREGIDSVDDLRRRHAAGELPLLPSADVVLLVDGYASLRADFEENEEALQRLIDRGGSFGIHVVVTLNRWADLRTPQQGVVGTRIELGLNDPSDSQVSRKLSSSLRSDEPGRALTDASEFAHVALPVLEDDESAEIGELMETLARQSALSWAGPEAMPIRLLPEDLDPQAVPDVGTDPSSIPLGLRQDTMRGFSLDLARNDPHLLVLGDTGCGKTTVLRGIVRGALAGHTAEDLVIALMDVRGELAEEVPESYLGGHAASAPLARQLAESIAIELEKRQTAKAAGPRILVVIDDFDVLAAGGTEPLRPLMPYLASARDLGLNVVITRPVLGASRAMYDTGLQSLRDTGGSTLVMSGDRGEGPLLPKVFAEQMVPGRARFLQRGSRATLVQIARFEAGGRS